MPAEDFHADLFAALDRHADDIGALVARYPERRAEIVKCAFARRLGTLEAEGFDGVAVVQELRAAVEDALKTAAAATKAGA